MPAAAPAPPPPQGTSTGLPPPVNAPPIPGVPPAPPPPPNGAPVPPATNGYPAAAVNGGPGYTNGAPAGVPGVTPPVPGVVPAQEPTPISPEMTEEDIAAAIEAEKRKLQLAQQAELDRLAHESAIREQQEAIRMQAEAEARAIAEAEEAKRKEEEFLANIEVEVAKSAIDHIANAPGRNLYFTVPEKLVAGKPAKIYINTENSGILGGRHSVRLEAGFNDWKLDKFDTSMKPAGPGGYFYTDFVVPELAYCFNCVFEADNMYDNNGGENWFETVHYGKNKEEVEKYFHDKKIYEAALEEATAEIEVEKYEQGSRKEGVADGELHKDGRCIVKADSPMKPGKTVQLMFNKAMNPIGGEGKIRCHVGFNKFAQGFEQEVTMELVRGAAADDNNYWWGASIKIPPTAYTLDMVISDEAEDHWDNNDGNDYRLLIQGGGNATNEEWDARTQERMAYIAIQKELEAKKQAEALKARRLRKAEASKTAREVTVRQTQHILVTEPTHPVAGEEVTITYHPENTNLGAAEEVYLTGGFNRWTHEDPPGAVKMDSSGDKLGVGSAVTCKIKIPEDAWMMDFVFSDGIAEGSTYDNHFGKDYHVPIEGSTETMPPLHVMHISVEMAPIAKVGGLGDVVTALARAVHDQGNLVEIILPKYSFFNQSPMLGGMEYETQFEWGGTTIQVQRCTVEGIQVFFIEPQNGFFDVGSVYGRNDDGVKFDYFCNAALEFLTCTQRQPDILHCHDWSTAEVAGAYWGNYHHYGLWKPKVVFTIHNMNYGQMKIGEAAFNSQITTTVSPSYAGEVAGHPAVNQNLHKFHGVRNGIDTEIWDPDTDQFLPMNYSADNHEDGKRAARETLQARFGLTWGSDQPMVAVVSRLTAQKGLDLIKHAIEHSVKRGAQFVLLGSAPDPRVQADFNGLAGSVGGPNAAFCFAFDEPLSHVVYAAADFILVPSMFEPCGLTQMISMRYGAVPVVRATGGLRDTVFDLDTEKSRAAWEVDGSTDYKATGDQTNGFSFEGTDPEALNYALDRALDCYYNDKIWFRQLQERIMRQDWSWNRPALDYIELYYSAIRG